MSCQKRHMPDLFKRVKIRTKTVPVEPTSPAEHVYGKNACLTTTSDYKFNCLIQRVYNENFNKKKCRKHTLVI